jgi:hypothetical protein
MIWTSTWTIWAVVLILQNFSFTFVSRARNSGSIKRHIIASVLSNGVWFASQVIMFSTLLEMLTGKHGFMAAVYTGIFYTFFTIVGAVVGHYISLKTEKGKSAVGANSKYAQITKEEWERAKNMEIATFRSIVAINKELARLDNALIGKETWDEHENSPVVAS